ncbi:MAG: nucleotide sugar dehydrogenase, partial [Methanobacteriaceae archaeon]|jgi:UDP-N-acetyl-D-glucosamine dehydrogenase|nr:MAG: UDP-N-acetyl-D-glucosamine dehydrogenase [Methanobacterium sp. BRmetb2]MCC7558326.1 nucleotide sugar dehydrogenase [Methanobacteriaceae archaeon]
MSWVADLRDKVNDESAVVGIVGLGYVGLPLAVSFSKKFKVIGYNNKPEKVEILQQGKSYIEDVKDEDLNLNSFHPTSDYQKLEKCDFIIIAVPTPLREDKSPDLSYIENAGETLGKILHKGQFVILKSTTYPGTTEDFLAPILEETSNLKVGEDFGLAYSPERVDPGNKKYKIENTANVVGGLTPEFTSICKMLFEDVTGNVIEVKDCKTAEAVKMIENIFRNVNIALVNELSLIFEKMDIDLWESIEAAKTKPYGFMPFYPGPGVGGHCIPLDPYYLSYRAKHFGIIPRFIETAGEINDFMPIHTVNLAKKGLKKIDKKLRGSKILVLGMAYKSNISDTRESPAVNIIEELKEAGSQVKVYDPHTSCIKTRYGPFHSEKDLKTSLKWADCAIIVTDHDAFIENPTMINMVKKDEIIIVDTRNALKLKTDESDYYIKL